MKKKLLSITTILIMIVALFISCSNEVQTGDKVSKVLFTSDDNMTRGLNSSSTSFAVEQYYWTYEAQKMDNSGLKTGETEGPVPVIKVEAGTPEAKGLGASVGPFSLGTWKFTLQAHEGSTGGNVLYTGVASNVVITDNPNGNKVSIKVHPLQDGHGYVEIAEGIGLKDSYGNPVLEYTEQITFSKAATPNVVETLAKPEGRVYTVPAGSWKVTIAYLSTSNPDIAYGRNSIYVNVFDNQKVVIGGSLEEITGNTSFETTVDGGTKAIAAPVQVKASEGVKLEVSSSPAAPESTAAKTEIQIPANALKSEGEAKLSVTSYDSPAASKFVVTEDNSTALAGLDIDLKIADTAVTEFNTPVTVSTYIAKGLIETPKVVYNGGGADMQPDPNTVTYNKETGLLTFQTIHFSQYFVVADVEAIDVTNNIAYATLKDALYNGDKSASVKIVLLKDVISSEGGEAGKWNVYGSDVELDMNGHTITDSFVADIISEYSLININTGSKLTIKNGAITSKGNREAVILVAGDNFRKAPELVFDHVNINKDETIQETLGPVVLIVGDGKAHFISGDIKWNSLQGAIKTHGEKTENAEIVFENGMNVDGIIYLPGKNDVTFNGGTYTSDYTVVYQKSGSLTINDGIFTARNASDNWQHVGSGMESNGNPVIVEACGYPGGNPIVAINGGKFFTGVSEVQPLVIDWRANEQDVVNNADVTGIKVPYCYANLVGNGNITLGVNNVQNIQNGKSVMYVSASAVTSGNGSEIAPLKTINEALANPDTEVIYVGEGTYVENIVIPESRKVSIVGLGTPVVKKDVDNRAIKADDLTKATTIEGIVDITSKAEVVLENLILTNDINVDPNSPVDNSMLIRSKASQFNMTIKDCLLTSSEVGRISSVVRQDYQKTDVINYNVINTCVELHQGHAKTKDGTVINGFDFTISDNKPQAECSIVNFNMKDSSITAPENANDYEYPIRIRKASLVDGAIVNSRIENPKNHYPLWFVNCGDLNGTVSEFNIRDSKLVGYSSIYLGHNENLVCNVDRCHLIGNNYNDGDSNVFNTLVIEGGKNDSILVNGSLIDVNQHGTAAMYLAGIVYVLSPSNNHNLVQLDEYCTLRFNGAIPATGDYMYFIEQVCNLDKDTLTFITDNNVVVPESVLGGSQIEMDPNIADFGDNVYGLSFLIK